MTKKSEEQRDPIHEWRSANSRLAELYAGSFVAVTADGDLLIDHDKHFDALMHRAHQRRDAGDWVIGRLPGHTEVSTGHKEASTGLLVRLRCALSAFLNPQPICEYNRGEWRCGCPANVKYDTSINPSFVSGCTRCGQRRPR